MTSPGLVSACCPCQNGASLLFWGCCESYSWEEQRQLQGKTWPSQNAEGLKSIKILFPKERIQRQQEV